MHPRRIAGATAVFTAAALSLTAGGAAQAASTIVAVAPNAAAPAKATVVLPTGDQVTAVTANGRTTYSPHVGTTGSKTGFDTYTAANGDEYVIPAEAVPFLNRQLNPAIFDVSALLRAGQTGSKKLPVTMTFAAGITPAAPPGVTLTSTSGQSAQGYLTASSGGQFAAGLRAAIGADVSAGRRPGASPLFGGLTSLSLASSGVSPFTTARTVTPHYQLYPLQINALDLNGAPTDSGFIVVTNTDSTREMNAFITTVDGIARVEVPAGHYALYASFDDFNTSGGLTAEHVVAIDDFTLTAAAAGASETLDERTATQTVTVSTPRPATEDYLDNAWERVAADGTTNRVTVITGSGLPVIVSPQPTAKVGTVWMDEEWGGIGTGPGAAYRYDVDFPSKDIPADEDFVATPSRLATVLEDFDQDPALEGDGTLLIGAVNQYSLPGADLVITAAPASGPVVHYIGTAGGGGWMEQFFSSNGVGWSNDVHTYTGGQTYALSWGHGPLAPNVGTHNGPMGWLPCLGCAAGSTASVMLNEVSDSEPDHYGTSTAKFDYTAYVNGTQVFTSNQLLGVEITGLPSTPSVIRQVLDTDASGTGESQSVTTHTDLTFVYQPGTQSAGDTLPSEDLCDSNRLITTTCQVQPVLNLGYHLATDDHNTTVPGPEALVLTVNHLSYDGKGSQAPITSASVSVSFDNGVTWQQATMIGNKGTYLATWTNPTSAVGTSPQLKVTATDAVGGSISQTTTAAYTIAAAGQ